MLQLILHLVGDYLTQTNWMAMNKTKRIDAAALHGLIYSLPFMVLLDLSWPAFAVICISHILIDYWRLAKYVVFVKNWINEPSIRWEDHNVTGYHRNTPEFMAIWLLIVADNTIHLVVNYSAILWL